MSLPPEAQAQKDYMQGLGMDANPYPLGSLERERYMMEMARCWNREMKDLRQQIEAGGLA